MVTHLKERKAPGYSPINSEAVALRNTEPEPDPKIASAVLRGLRVAVLAALWLLGVALLLGAIFLVDPKPASESGDAPQYWGPFRP